jgi:DNA-binding SARP family transcriptional activator
MITCRLLGPVEIGVDGGAPPAELSWRKNLGLLVYLARSPKHSRTRDHLTGLFWADKPEQAARHSLREAIRVLRKCLGEDGLVTDHDQIRLDPSRLQLDLAKFERHERSEDWGPAAALVAGGFMEGFGIPDASGFEDWLVAEREHWRGRCVHALARRADDLLRHGELHAAAELATQALAIDPASDPAARAAMQTFALLGDRAAALACYSRLRQRLDQLGGAPERETADLAERVQSERQWRLAEGVPAEPTSGAELRRAPLVGRETGLARLVDAFEGCVSGATPTAGVIVAAPGLGKSRLAEEVMTRARLAGAAVAAVRCVEADLDQAWSGTLGLARGGLLEAHGLAAASPRALGAFAQEIAEWKDRFGGATGELMSFGPALVEVLRAIAAEHPVAVLIDDAQWLDPDSMGALIAAPRDLAGAPVFLLFATQAEPSRPELDDLRSRLGRDLAGTSCVLAPLDRAALRRLTAWAMPDYTEEQVDRLTRRLEADTAGLPLLAVELLHALALGLDLGRLAGAWPQPFHTLDSSLPSDLPDSIVAAIRVGFRRLGADAQQVLAAASVLGDRVAPAELEKATGVSGKALEAALDEVEWQRWLAAEPRGYSFVAAIARHVVAEDMITEGQRQRFLAAR